MGKAEAQEDKDILYLIKLEFNYPWDDAEGKRAKELQLVVKIHEYEIKNETDKSYMAARELRPGYYGEVIRFPKENMDEVTFDTFNNHFWGAKLAMTETTREEVEEFGVPKIKAEVKEWFDERASYYNERSALLGGSEDGE